MNSKISFDIGEGYLPCVVAEIKQSDDVRDKIAKGFKERFGFESNLCHVEIQENLDMNGQLVSTKLIFNPISIKDAKQLISEMDR